MSKTTSNATLELDELKEHFKDENNHYLYKKRDDGTVACYMCCDFQIVADGQVIGWGNCGDAIVYNTKTKDITIEREER